MFVRRHFAIRTPDGYVGRRTVSGPIEGNLPRAFAYTWTDSREVAAVAGRFPGAEIVITRTEQI